MIKNAQWIIEQAKNLISYDGSRNGDTVLVCSHCGNEYTIKSRMYRKSVKRGYKNNFCSKICKIHSERQNEQERFINSFELGNEDECWNWTMGKDKNGYGLFGIHNKNNVKCQCRAHRYSYELYIGEIPDGMVVMHSCDNPSCVNPNHLSVGTNKDNCNDKVAKGRYGDSAAAPGERNIKAKLSEEQVIEIRRLCEEGKLKKKTISQMFGITTTNIRGIELRKLWKHI